VGGEREGERTGGRMVSRARMVIVVVWMGREVVHLGGLR